MQRFFVFSYRMVFTKFFNRFCIFINQSSSVQRIVFCILDLGSCERETACPYAHHFTINLVSRCSVLFSRTNQMCRVPTDVMKMKIPAWQTAKLTHKHQKKKKTTIFPVDYFSRHNFLFFCFIFGFFLFLFATVLVVLKFYLWHTRTPTQTHLDNSTNYYYLKSEKKIIYI